MNFSQTRYKELLLKTMSEFIKVCDQNGIEYIGAYGSVLGAVRHKGLIPWDDDIDVFMTRENYEKFLQLKKTLNGSGYEIVDLDNDGYYLPYAKFCDANTSIWEIENLPFVLGIFIDVFPLDFVEENDAECVALRDEYIVLFRKYVRSKRSFRFADLLSLSGLKDFFKTVYYRKTVKKEMLRNIENKIKNKRGPYRMYYRSMDKYSKSKFDASWFDECIEVPYENFSIRIPKNYDAYLTQCYGNYMEPPPIEKRVSQHFHYFVDLDKRLSEEEIRKIKKQDH